MNCERAREHFSEWMDGSLEEPIERALREHVEACDACTAEWRSYERAVVALRSVGARQTPAHVKQVVLAAVDAAAREDARAGEDDFRRAALLAAGRFEERLRRRRVATHVAALLAGAALVLAWVALRGSGAREDSNAKDGVAGESERNERAPEPRVVERSILVPRFVDVVREVEVERIVERPVVERVERVVRRGPLLSLDFGALAAIVEDMAAALDRAARSQSLLAERSEDEARVPTPAARADEPLEHELDFGRGDDSGLASVRFVRTGETLRLETFGAVGEVVPVLLSQLESEDLEVVALVERRLEAIRGAADAEALAPKPRSSAGSGLREREVLARLFTGSDSTAKASPSERWRSWWAENGALIAEAEQLGDL